MQFDAELSISRQEEELYNRLLEIESNDTDDVVVKAGYDEDATIHVVSAEFGNGYFADFKLCSGQSNFYGDSVLFNESGCEVCVPDCFDQIHGGDVFEFYSGNDVYRVTVKVG